MESARNNFYDTVEKSIQPLHVTSGVYRNDILALWILSEGLRVGYAIRLITAPLLRSSYPIFEWKEESSKGEKNQCLG